jgi:hypothetical protein
VITAQNSRSGDLVEREHDGQTYRFRVREGGYADAADNKFVYLADPEEKPLPAELRFQIESNEAAVMYEDGEGVIRFYPSTL